MADPLVPGTPAEHLLAAFAAAEAGATDMAADHLRRAEGAIAGFTADGLTADALPDGPALGALAAGTALMLRGVDEPAIDALETAAESGASLPLYLAAVSVRRSGDAARAADLLTRAIAVAPGFRSAFLERSEALLALEDGEAALADLRTALDLRPVPGVALRLGVMAEALDDVETARTAYETLLELAPDSFVANNQLAWFLVSRDGETTRALDLARRADSLRPGNASVLDTLGWIHFLRGDLDTAKRYLEDAFEVSGGAVPVIRYHLAEVTFRTGHPDRADDLLDGLADADASPEVARDVAELRARIAEGGQR